MVRSVSEYSTYSLKARTGAVTLISNLFYTLHSNGVQNPVFVYYSVPRQLNILADKLDLLSSFGVQDSRADTYCDTIINLMKQ